MDRWQDADDDITHVQHQKGRVARMGIAGFVQPAGVLSTACLQIAVLLSATAQLPAELSSAAVIIHMGARRLPCACPAVACSVSS